MQINVPVMILGIHDLYPVMCGCHDCESGHSFGPAMREYYLIHYIKSGQGSFTYGEKSWQLTKGQCFLICPNEITLYKADEKQPWHYTWVAFSGEYAKGLLAAVGLGSENHVFESGPATVLFEELYEKIIRNDFAHGKPEYYLLSLLWSLFFLLPQVETHETQSTRYVKKTRDYIFSMYTNKISVASLAQFCGLDRRYLCRIFKKEIGMTLQEYILDYRLSKAHALLLETSLTIGDTARSVGYTDVYNFSKMFKKKYGVSPRNIRVQNNG
jgi:AraC-like DNA-binding protein